MKTYICDNCGNKIEHDSDDSNLLCPICGSILNEYSLIENNLADNEIDAILLIVVTKQMTLIQKTEKSLDS